MVEHYTLKVCGQQHQQKKINQKNSNIYIYLPFHQCRRRRRRRRQRRRRSTKVVKIPNNSKTQKNAPPTHRHTDIATYQLNRPRAWFSDKSYAYKIRAVDTQNSSVLKKILLTGDTESLDRCGRAQKNKIWLPAKKIPGKSGFERPGI